MILSIFIDNPCKTVNARKRITYRKSPSVRYNSYRLNRKNVQEMKTNKEYTESQGVFWHVSDKVICYIVLCVITHKKKKSEQDQESPKRKNIVF